MLRTCEDLGRLDRDTDEELVAIMLELYDDELLVGLFANSDPKWRKGKLGGFRKKADQVLLDNKARLEEMIDEHLATLAAKGVPEDFTPGDPELGVPPSLSIPFDRDGNVLPDQVPTASEARAAATEQVSDIALSLQKARWLATGWRLRVEVINEGQEPLADGQLDVFVVDSDDEVLLGETTRSLPALAPGESTEIWLSIQSRGTPEREVMFGGFVRIGDDSATDNEDWLMTDEIAEDVPDVPIVTDADAPAGGGPPDTIAIVGSPKMILTDNALCAVVVALTSTGDTTEKIRESELRLTSPGPPPIDIMDGAPPRWSASASEHGLVAGKILACFQPEPEHCDTWQAEVPESVLLAVSVTTRRDEVATGSYPLDSQQRRGLFELCR